MAIVVFLGTAEYAVPILERLDALHTVAAVITQPDQPAGRGRSRIVQPPVKIWAAAHGLAVYQPRRLSRDEALIAHLRALKPDVLVLAAYGQMLRQNVLSLAPHGCIGVHASLLPRWRGAAPIAAAILAGDTVTGVTLMLTDTGMDTGPVIAQRSIAVAPHETTPSLTSRLAQCGAELLADTLPDWLLGKITPQPQDESRATYAPPFNHQQGKLDFSRPAVFLERQVRALNPWPGTWTMLEGKLLKILEAQSIPEVTLPEAPGTVVLYHGQVAVVTGEGLLLIPYIQPAGKRPMSAQQYANGHPHWIGAILSGEDV